MWSSAAQRWFTRTDVRENSTFFRQVSFATEGAVLQDVCYRPGAAGNASEFAGTKRPFAAYRGSHLMVCGSHRK